MIGEDADDEEVWVMFSREIKGAGLIYTEHGWAIYDSRINTVETDRKVKEVGIRI